MMMERELEIVRAPKYRKWIVALQQVDASMSGNPCKCKRSICVDTIKQLLIEILTFFICFVWCGFASFIPFMSLAVLWPLSTSSWVSFIE